MWATPPRDVAPKALLLLAHGMCHGCEDFSNEEGFGGLPEEHRMVEIAQSRGFVPVAISSTDRVRKAWTVEVDGPKVAQVLDEILQREGLDAALPKCAVGVSNGGSFSMLLPMYVPLRAIVCQIMAIPNELVDRVPNIPPTLFVHMPRDARTAAGVKSNIAKLRSLGKVGEERLCHPRPITPDFFMKSCGFDESTSAKMAEALCTAGLVDGDGVLLQDPRASTSTWRAALQAFGDASGDSLVANRSPISEVLNVAWGLHEITSEGMEEALDFCERYL